MLHKLDNPISQCSLKFDSNAKGEFEGYASVFNSVDKVGDTIAPGAFAESIGIGMPKMFVNHDHWSVPIGSWVEANEDSKGLLVRGSINMDHKDGASVYSALKRGDMDSLSIGFTHRGSVIEESEDGGRVIHKAALMEVSIVTFPAEPKAQITSVKSLEELQTVRDLERFFRDEFAVNQKVAATFLSHAKRILSGDLVSAEKQIKELKQRIEQKNAVDSLMQTLERLEVTP